jgi:hypothetical protein
MDTELSFEAILKRDNNWILFKELYKNKLPENVIRETEKMLTCCTRECGFAKYVCLHCGNIKTIPFSCKSKLCSRCGKKHTDIWSQIVSEKLLNCDHRHIVLTISNKLWPFFINTPSLQRILLDTAAKIIKKTFSKTEKVTAGFILVLHPFGDDLKPNFHVHALVTCGGLAENNTPFINVSYIDYEFIRKTWQYEILTAIRKALPQHKHILNPIIDWCFKYKTNGFVIFADRVIKGSKKATLSYIARYTRHPPISKRRIISYDGSYVSFSYEAYGKEQTKTMPKFEFIKAVLQHTSSKQFKTIRRFGLYSRRSSVKYEIAKSLLTPPSLEQIQTFDWRKNLTAFTGKDPLACDKCREKLTLFSITYRDKSGTLKTIEKNDWFYETIPLKPSEDILQDDEKPRWHQICMPAMSY